MESSLDRRGFLGAILAAGVAPAIVKASSLMAVRARPEWAHLSQYHSDDLINLIESRIKAAQQALKASLEKSMYSEGLYSGWTTVDIPPPKEIVTASNWKWSESAVRLG